MYPSSEPVCPHSSVIPATLAPSTVLFSCSSYEMSRTDRVHFIIPIVHHLSPRTSTFHYSALSLSVCLSTPSFYIQDHIFSPPSHTCNSQLLWSPTYIQIQPTITLWTHSLDSSLILFYVLTLFFSDLVSISHHAWHYYLISPFQLQSGTEKLHHSFTHSNILFTFLLFHKHFIQNKT